MTNNHGTQAESWFSAARQKLDAAALGPKAEEIGRVEEVGDGIALVSGLPDARLAELLRFEKGQFGFVQSLERDRIGCVLLDDVDGVEAGDNVRGTGDVVRAPVGRNCWAAWLTRSGDRSTARVRSPRRRACR